MCNICGIVGWIMDMIVTLITWCLSCLVIVALCIGFTVAIVAGVSYGYNYSIAEFMHTARDDVMWFMRYNPLNPTDKEFKPYETRQHPATEPSDTRRRTLPIEPNVFEVSQKMSITPQTREKTKIKPIYKTRVENTTKTEPKTEEPLFYAEEDFNVERSGHEIPPVHLVQAPPIDYDDIFSFKKLQTSVKTKNPSRTTSVRRVTTVKLTQTTIDIKTLVSRTPPITTLITENPMVTPIKAPARTSNNWLDITHAVYISDLYPPKTEKKTTFKNKVLKSVLHDIPDYTEDFL